MLTRRSGLRTETSSRLVQCIEEFVAAVGSRAFPCMFATREMLADKVLFGLVEHPDAVLDGAVSAMHEAVDAIKQDDTQVVVLFLENPGPKSLSDDVDLASRLLRRLIREGSSDWPMTAATDPMDPLWTLWVDGVDLFINVNSPRHIKRRSRNLGSAFTLVVQSRRAFDRFADDDTTRSTIRARVARYDDVPPHPALGSYGDPTNHEVLQYFLGEGTDAVHLIPSTEGDRPPRCPRQKDEA